MARKNYTHEFRQRAVDLYESTPGARDILRQAAKYFAGETNW